MKETPRHFPLNQPMKVHHNIPSTHCPVKRFPLYSGQKMQLKLVSLSWRVTIRSLQNEQIAKNSENLVMAMTGGSLTTPFQTVELKMEKKVTMPSFETETLNESPTLVPDSHGNRLRWGRQKLILCRLEITARRKFL